MNILKRLYILFPVLFTTVITGCTGMRSGGGGDSDTGLYPGAATVAGSTVVGAGTGAAIGALAGPPGAAVGAVAGAAAGAGVGLGVNAVNKQNQSYVVAPRDPVNRNYVTNPYNKNEKLYVKDAAEGKVMRDPVGRSYVVGP